MGINNHRGGLYSRDGGNVLHLKRKVYNKALSESYTWLRGRELPYNHLMKISNYHYVSNEDKKRPGFKRMVKILEGRKHNFFL